MSPLPHITRTESDGVTVMCPVGDFDIAGTDLLRSTLRESITATQNKLVVDLSATTFLDSTALGTLLGAAKRAGGWDGWVRLVAPPPNIRRVLRVTELDTVFGLYDTVDQAINHVTAPNLTVTA